jgi:hypothetical protein
MRKLMAWIDSRSWVKTFIIPLVVTLPPIALAQKNWDKDWEAFLKDHTGLRWSLLAWPVVLVAASFAYQKLKPSKKVTTLDFEELLEVLRRIVATKVDRFAEALEKLKHTDDFRAKKVFTTITQPDTQIHSIVAGIYQYFEATRPASIPAAELRIRVCLAGMGEKYISNFAHFFPPGTDPRSGLEHLQRDDAGFTRAKEQKQTVVVEDFIKESTAGHERCFTVTHDSRRNENGSMICHPVIIRKSGEVPYVISICSAKPGYFKKADADYYAGVLEHFTQRITLEFFLKKLKGNIK